MFQSSRHSGVFPAGLPVSGNEPEHVLASHCTGDDGVSLSFSLGKVPMVAGAVVSAPEGGGYSLVKDAFEGIGAAGAAAQEAGLAGPPQQRGEASDGDERSGAVEAGELPGQEGERGPHPRHRKEEGPTWVVGEPLLGRLVGDRELGTDSEGFLTQLDDGCCPQAPVRNRDGLRLDGPSGVLGQRLDAAQAGRGSFWQFRDDTQCPGGADILARRIVAETIKAGSRGSNLQRLARADRLPGMADAATQKRGKAA